MPEELKSLNIVLEMKTEELKNLRAKNMELERKVLSHIYVLCISIEIKNTFWGMVLSFRLHMKLFTNFHCRHKLKS